MSLPSHRTSFRPLELDPFLPLGLNCPVLLASILRLPSILMGRYGTRCCSGSMVSKMCLDSAMVLDLATIVRRLGARPWNGSGHGAILGLPESAWRRFKLSVSGSETHGQKKSEGKEVLHLGQKHREVATTLSAPLPPQRNSIKPECKAFEKRREDWYKHDYADFGADVIESSPQTHVCSPPEAPGTEEEIEIKGQRPQRETLALTVMVVGPQPQKTEIAKARG